MNRCYIILYTLVYYCCVRDIWSLPLEMEKNTSFSKKISPRLAAPIFNGMVNK